MYININSNKEKEPPISKKSKVITIINFKGGSGKTSLGLSNNIHCARLGLNSLLIDADPQHNATLRMGIEADQFSESRLTNVIRTLEQKINPPNPLQILDSKLKPIIGDKMGIIGLVPGHTFAEREMDIFNRMGTRDSKVNTYQEICDSFNDLIIKYSRFFNTIFIDTAPSIDSSLLCLVSAYAADEIIIPVDGVEGGHGLLSTLQWLNDHISPLRPNLPRITIVMSKYQKDPCQMKKLKGLDKSSLPNQIHRALKKCFGSHVCDNGIKEIPRLRTSIYDSKFKNNISQNVYVPVCDEILKKINVSRISCLKEYTLNITEFGKLLNEIEHNAGGKFDIKSLKLIQ